MAEKGVEEQVLAMERLHSFVVKAFVFTVFLLFHQYLCLHGIL